MFKIDYYVYVALSKPSYCEFRGRAESPNDKRRHDEQSGRNHDQGEHAFL